MLQRNLARLACKLALEAAKDTGIFFPIKNIFSKILHKWMIIELADNLQWAHADDQTPLKLSSKQSGNMRSASRCIIWII